MLFFLCFFVLLNRLNKYRCTPFIVVIRSIIHTIQKVLRRLTKTSSNRNHNIATCQRHVVVVQISARQEQQVGEVKVDRNAERHWRHWLTFPTRTMHKRRQTNQLAAVAREMMMIRCFLHHRIRRSIKPLKQVRITKMYKDLVRMMRICPCVFLIQPLFLLQ